MKRRADDRRPHRPERRRPGERQFSQLSTADELEWYARLCDVYVHGATVRIVERFDWRPVDLNGVVVVGSFTTRIDGVVKSYGTTEVLFSDGSTLIPDPDNDVCLVVSPPDTAIDPDVVVATWRAAARPRPRRIDASR